MVVKERPLNKVVVAPVIAHGGEPNPDKIKGYDYIPLLYANIFLCAKKKSGKTNVIYNLLDQVAGPKTTVYIFCSTVHKDATYDAIMKMLKKKNISFEAHTHFLDKGGKTNILTDIISHADDSEKAVVFEKVIHRGKITRSGVEQMANRYNYSAHIPHGETEQYGFKAPLSRRDEAYYMHNIRDGLHGLPGGEYQGRNYVPWRGEFPSGFDNRTDRSKREWTPKFSLPNQKPYKVKFGDDRTDNARDEGEDEKPDKISRSLQDSPESIFVFDDLGKELRHPSVTQLTKTNRHEKSKVIISSQYLTDLMPEAIKQLDFVMLFKKFGVEKLKKIYEDLDLSIEFPDFEELYRYATNQPFSFFYIDVRREQFRRNFNTQLLEDGGSKKEKESSEIDANQSKRRKHKHVEEESDEDDE